jgi:hypothetical protein
MNIAMFIVGFFIFAAYVGFLMWNIFTNHRKNREENYPNYYSRHGRMNEKGFDEVRYPHSRVSKMKDKKEEVE